MIADLLQKRTVLYTFIGICIGVIIGGFLLLTYIELESRKLENEIFPNVYIDDQNLGGMTKEQASSLFKKDDTRLKSVNFFVIYKDQQIATLSARTVNLRTNVPESIDRAYLIGRTPHTPTKLKQRITSILGLEKTNFKTQVIYDQNTIEDFIADQEEIYNKPAKNALFEFKDGRVTSFKPDEKGIKLNSDVFKENFEKLLADLKEKPANKKIVLSDTVIDPEITLAKANQFGIEELIGEGRSDYSHSIETRIHNVLLASSKFHGVLVPKGETFSFNDIIGDISATTGYQPAYVIKNGKTVLGDGGGVCQVSTTMFRAALNTGLPIEERHAHAYRVGYYENDAKPGFDATIFSPSVDFKFINDTPSSILIQREVDEENHLLAFKFYGKRDKRKVEISEPLLWDVSAPPPPLMQDDPTLPKGVTKQVDFPAYGGKSKFTLRVTYADGKIYEKEFFSSYRPWQAVYLVGTQG